MPYVEITANQAFKTSTTLLPLAELTVKYEANGGLRSAKYYVLEIYHSGKKIAALSPKEGYTSQQLDRLYNELQRHTGRVV